jgi:hypothetical protein
LYSKRQSGSEESRKKRRKSGQEDQKRNRYDLLRAFFRFFFREDPRSMVRKDVIYGLYFTKVPTWAHIARNAVYRQMWSIYTKEVITPVQHNYREQIKGLRLVSSENEPYEQYEQDRAYLLEAGVDLKLNVSEEELANVVGFKDQTENDMRILNDIAMCEDLLVQVSAMLKQIKKSVVSKAPEDE